MAQVTVYHNVSRDAFSGFNYGNEDGNNPHYLVKVFAFDTARFTQYSEPSHNEILSECFEEFNVGETPLAAEYRTRQLRSLSIGDVIDIGGRAYSCERFEWTPRKGSDLVVLNGTAAEDQIRARLGFWPGEELSITVPLV